MRKKMTVDFNEEFTDMLEQLAKREGRSRAEILRRSIALYKYLDDEVREGDKEGRSVSVTDKEGHILKQIKWL